jgi:hypothetical protein
MFSVAGRTLHCAIAERNKWSFPPRAVLPFRERNRFITTTWKTTLRKVSVAGINNF